MSVATIIVTEGVVALRCHNGQAQVSIPVCASSVLGSWPQVMQAVKDLVLLARPQRAGITFVFPDGDPALLELEVAKLFLRLPGVERVCWSSAIDCQPVDILVPSVGMPRDDGWRFPFAGLRAPAALVNVTSGSLTLLWKDQQVTQALPTHPRLVLPSLGAVADALVHARRSLKIPNGVLVNFTPQLRCTELERMVLADALVESQLKVDRPARAKSPGFGRGPAGVFMWLLFASLLALDFFGIIPHLPLWVFFAFAFGMVFLDMTGEWLDDRARKRALQSLLSPCPSN